MATQSGALLHRWLRVLVWFALKGQFCGVQVNFVNIHKSLQRLQTANSSNGKYFVMVCVYVCAFAQYTLQKNFKFIEEISEKARQRCNRFYMIASILTQAVRDKVVFVMIVLF